MCFLGARYLIKFKINKLKRPADTADAADSTHQKGEKWSGEGAKGRKRRMINILPHFMTTLVFSFSDITFFTFLIY